MVLGGCGWWGLFGFNRLDSSSQAPQNDACGRSVSRLCNDDSLIKGTSNDTPLLAVFFVFKKW